MTFLSAIFRKKTGYSYVRSWAKDREKRAGNANDTVLNHLFGAIVLGISSFGTDLEPSRRTKLAVAKEYERAPYSGDASLFEVACYFLFEIDLWLYNNKPKYRRDVSSYLLHNLVDLFSDALKMDNISHLITDRLKLYGESASDKNDAEIYMELLSDLVRRTKFNTLPQEYRSKTVLKFHEDDMFDDFIKLKMSLAVFTTHMLKANFQMLENFFNLVSTDE